MRTESPDSRKIPVTGRARPMALRSAYPESHGDLDASTNERSKWSLDGTEGGRGRGGSAQWRRQDLRLGEAN